MKKSGVLLMTALFGMLLVMVSCGGSEAPKYTEGQELTLSGKMKVIDNDGEAYVLVTDQGEFFELRNPLEKYRTEGVPINAKVKIVKLITTARVGPSCEVIEYIE